MCYTAVVVVVSLCLDSSWQYAAVDDSGGNLVVAGRAGFALYSCLNKKWKLFGNEIQV